MRLTTAPQNIDGVLKEIKKEKDWREREYQDRENNGGNFKCAKKEKKNVDIRFGRILVRKKRRLQTRR